MKNFADLTEREVLAVAISSEEEDSRIYMTFAEDLAERYPDSAKVFEEMAEEERGHRHRLLELYEQRFGAHLPPIRREDVKGFLRRRPIWLTKNLSLDAIRKEAATMEFEAERFYVKAAERTHDVGVRRLLGDLAEAEKGHENVAARLTDQILSPDVRAEPLLVHFQQHVAMAFFLFRHFLEYLGRFRITLGKVFCEGHIDPAVFLFCGDRHRQHFSLGQIGEILHNGAPAA